MAVPGSAIGTLIVFILSIIFVIRPTSIPIQLPRVGRRKIHINLLTAPLIAIAILWAAQCLGPAQIRTGIVGTQGVKPYNILILFFSLAYMAITLDITGVLQAAAFWVSNKGGKNGWKLYIYFYILLTVLSIFLGNDPVILSGTAFLVYYTEITRLNPKSWLISEFAAANTASMVLFVGNPTNVVICEGFRINNAAFTAYTILPFLACSVACLGALALQFRSAYYIKPRLDQKKDLDVFSVLLDPFGAWVGGTLLGTCLVVIIVVSFFHVDVWMISLPFAVFKFLYDMGIDHWRYIHGVRVHPPIEKGEDLALRSMKQGEETTAGNGKQGLKRSSPSPLPAVYPPQGDSTRVNSRSNTGGTTLCDSNPFHTVPTDIQSLAIAPIKKPWHLRTIRGFYDRALRHFSVHFPTLYIAFPRLPFALIPFAFSQFILIEALARQGWILIFSSWLIKATNNGSMHPTIWLVGSLGVILCNISGTNIGATILLTKVVQGAHFDSLESLSGDGRRGSFRAAAIALAVASNIGAVSFTFSASLAGLLWRGILMQKGVRIEQWVFAKWNLLPLVVMCIVGLGVVSAEMAVLYR